jgi:hypothetical protein
MSRFFEAVKALLPQSRACAHFADNNKYRFMQALSVLPEDIRTEAERVYRDLFPETTRCAEKWERVFALYFTRQEIQKRQEILTLMWRIRSGGQSAQFLQDVLRYIDDRILVIENVPLSNPRHSSTVSMCVLGYKNMRCGNPKAVCGYRVGNAGFVPAIIQNGTSGTYDDIFNDPRWWGFCFYVCASTERNALKQILYVKALSLDAVWRNYVEYIILKIKPVHTTAIVFIDWKNK